MRMRQCGNMKMNIPFHPSSSYGQEGADGERGYYKSYFAGKQPLHSE